MLKFSANLSFLYQDLPFLERFSAAAKDGFRAVEYMSPYEVPAAQVAETLRENRLVQALFNMPAGNWGAGERGIACLPDRVDEFRAGVETAIAYARVLGCPKVNVIAGIAPQDVPATVLEATLVANLKYAAPRFAEAGVKLLIEPINTRDIPGFFLTNSAHAERILDAVSSDNLLIQYDFYHMQVMQGDLVATFERLRERIGHVQIADNPGRHEPGTGEINYPFIFAALERLRYDGWVGCEYRPLAGTSEGLGWLRDRQR